MLYAIQVVLVSKKQQNFKYDADILFSQQQNSDYKIIFELISQNHRTMQEKNSTWPQRQTAAQDLFKNNSHQIPTKSQVSASNSQNNTPSNNQHGIYLTHEQKIQATYNFQSLFRKKSHIYNMHKNKKKLLNKNQKNQSTKNDDPDKQSKNVKKGHWTDEQNKKYHWFLQLHNKHFILKHLRRTDKIFKTMSSFISTREAQQCRSHHQKMQKKYKNFYQIIIKLRMEYYGTCNTSVVKADLQQNGFIKQKNEFLIQQNTLISLQNRQSDKDSQKYQCKKQDQDDLLMHMKGENQQQDQNVDSEQQGKQKQGNLFFGQNYEKQLNYKLY